MGEVTMHSRERARWQRRQKRDQEFRYRRKQFDDCCAYCQRKHGTAGRRSCLDRDHVIPRQLHGPDNIANIVPACRDCQEQKASQQLWTEFTPPRPHPALLVRFPPPTLHAE